MYRIYDLMCNDMTEPVGIDSNNIYFSWKLASEKMNVVQSAYQISVYRDEELIWDSDEIKSDDVFAVAYEGDQLQNGTLYRWQVSSVSNTGDVALSEACYFTTGVFDRDFWKAKWIEADYIRKPSNDSTDFKGIIMGQVGHNDHAGENLNPALCFRKVFNISKKVSRAVIYSTAKGIYQLSMDEDVISSPLTPEYTSYEHHLQYQVYDITPLMSEGLHCISWILADGWYTGKIGLMGIGNQYGDTNAILTQIVITYEDGSEEVIMTDEEVQWHESPYRYADLFVGEYYDGMLEGNIKNYKTPEYDASTWKPVTVKSYGYDNLEGQKAPKVVILKEIEPRFLRTPRGEFILDAEEVTVGYTEVTFEGVKGQCVSFEHSEVLDANGEFLQNIRGQNKNQLDTYVCGYDGTHHYCPQFTFHGFRYVRVTGLNRTSQARYSIKVLGSDLKVSGIFKTSNPLINQLQNNILRSQQTNMLSVPTDCPQRERAGWTGDVQIFAPTATFNMDVKAFLGRWLYDMRFEQMTDGQIPNVVPAIDSNKYVGSNTNPERICSAGWGDACVIVPYRLYEAYGDTKVLKENYKMMLKWMAFVEEEVSTGISGDYDVYVEKYLWNSGFHYGDWLLPSILKKTGLPIKTAMLTKDEVATAMYAYTTSLMTEICQLMGDQECSEHYRELNDHIKEAFSKAYVNEDGKMRHQLQGLYVLALQFDLVQGEKKKAVLRELVRIMRANGNRLDTGFISVPFLLDVLVNNGEKKLAYDILYQEAPPSWLYAVKNGATTIWEKWEAIQEDGTRTNTSYNHFAFGCVGDFMYRKIGGLTTIEPGYKKVRINPDYECRLNSVDLQYQTPYGVIDTSWKRDGEDVHLNVVLPPNTTAEVNMGDAYVTIGSGIHEFDIKIKEPDESSQNKSLA